MESTKQTTAEEVKYFIERELTLPLRAPMVIISSNAMCFSSFAICHFKSKQEKRRH